MDCRKEEIFGLVDLMPTNNALYQYEDANVHLCYFNDNFAKLHETTREDLEQTYSDLDWIVDEDRTIIHEKIIKHSQTDFSKELDLLFRLKNKEKGFIWIHLTAKYIGDMDGKKTFLATLLDVDKEVNSSYSLMDAFDRYICVIEKKTKRLLYANKMFYDLIDLDEASSKGKHCYEVLCKVQSMRTNNDCLCFSCINKPDPIEYYNEEKGMYLTLQGKEIKWGEYDAYVFWLNDVTSEKKKEAELKDSQNRFEVALNNSDLMIWEYDMVNHRCIASQKANRGYNIPLIIENYPESLYEMGHTPPETVEQIKECKRRLENGETGFSVERKTINKDGNEEWQKVEYTLEKDENGKPIRAIVCGLDITRQKELEAKYNEQRQYRNNLAKNAMFSIHLDLDGNEIVEYICNDPVLLPMIKENMNAKEFLANFFITSSFTAESGITKESLQKDALLEAFSIGRTTFQTVYECMMLNKYLNLNISLNRQPVSNHVEAFIIITDVTEVSIMNHAFQMLVQKDYDYVGMINVKTSKAMFLAKSSLAQTTLYEVGNEFDFDTWVYEIGEAHKEANSSMDDYDGIVEKMSVVSLISKLKGDKYLEFNFKALDENNRVRTYRMGFNFIDELHNRILFSRADVTNALEEERAKQIELENALKEAKEASLAKTDFLSRMSHDMRTPMNGILGMTRLTQDIPSLSEEVQENLSSIEESSMYLLSLINDTLDMSKIESKKLMLQSEAVNTVDLCKHIIQTVTPLANNKNIFIVKDTVGLNPLYIYSDKIRLRQIFLNILSNSVKYTPNGGKITVRIETIDKTDKSVRGKVTITDTGCGMSQEFLQHLYDPFSQEEKKVTRDQEGTGLGMSIVKNLVELMNGTIEVESEVGKGTKVTVEIPFDLVQDIPSQTKSSEESEKELEGKKILLVEDHPLNAKIAKRLLEKKGVIVVHAEDGKEGVETFERSALHEFDCVLMDIRMPVMNGLDATKEIRKLDREDATTVPILAMTANAYAEDVQSALAAGMNAHLAKPIQPEQMYEVIAKFI